MAKDKLRFRSKGIGGTIGEFERQGAPDVKVKWDIGLQSGAGKGSPKKNPRGPGGKRGRLRQKSQTVGFGFKVQF